MAIFSWTDGACCEDVWEYHNILQTSKRSSALTSSLISLLQLFAQDVHLSARYAAECPTKSATNASYNILVRSLVKEEPSTDEAIRIALLHFSTFNSQVANMSHTQKLAVLGMVRELDVWLGELLTSGRVNFYFVHDMA